MNFDGYWSLLRLYGQQLDSLHRCLEVAQSRLTALMTDSDTYTAELFEESARLALKKSNQADAYRISLEVTFCDAFPYQVMREHTRRISEAARSSLQGALEASTIERELMGE